MNTGVSIASIFLRKETLFGTYRKLLLDSENYKATANVINTRNLKMIPEKQTDNPPNS